MPYSSPRPMHLIGEHVEYTKRVNDLHDTYVTDCLDTLVDLPGLALSNEVEPNRRPLHPLQDGVLVKVATLSPVI